MGKHGRNNIRRTALAAAVTFGVAFGASGCGETGPEKSPSVAAGSLAGLEGENSGKLTTAQWFAAQDVGDLAIKILTDPGVTTKRIDPTTVTNKVYPKKADTILVDSNEDFTVSQPQATISFDRETGTLTTAVVGARTMLDDPNLPISASVESTLKVPEDSPLKNDRFITPEDAKSAIQSGVIPTGLLVEASPRYNMDSVDSPLVDPLAAIALIRSDFQFHASK